MENNTLPQRKSVRLKNYDYSQPGYYFLTICTQQRKKLLCNIVGMGLCAHPKVELTDIGVQLEKVMQNISTLAGISVDQFVIMPNHLHILIAITKMNDQKKLTLQDIIGRIKSYTTYQYNNILNSKGKLLWQRSFHEHIVRNEHDLKEIRDYIKNNPLKWNIDRYYED